MNTDTKPEQFKFLNGSCNNPVKESKMIKLCNFIIRNAPMCFTIVVLLICGGIICALS